MSVAAFRWQKDRLDVLDQRLLPHNLSFIQCFTPEEVAQSIRSMAVRGAPAIGCCAAYGMVLAALIPESLEPSASLLKASRPTAVNLSWAVNRMMKVAESIPYSSKSHLFDALLKEATLIESEDVQINKQMGRFGAELFKNKSVLLTHCNTGSLATAGFGTALGVIRELRSQGKIVKVFVDETRPYLQGARLTAWELTQEKIPFELITDNMAGHFMKTEKIDGILVGCDRVAVNGDTANKIGTYSLAILARYHKIPFYVAMPLSTLDLSIESGEDIKIEERTSNEVVEIGGVPIAPKGTVARHPAFDLTPSELITAIVTEKGVVYPPFVDSLKNLLKLKKDDLTAASHGLF